jgi:hypothetical protein
MFWEFNVMVQLHMVQIQRESDDPTSHFVSWQKFV